MSEAAQRAAGQRDVDEDAEMDVDVSVEVDVEVPNIQPSLRSAKHDVAVLWAPTSRPTQLCSCLQLVPLRKRDVALM